MEIYSDSGSRRSYIFSHAKKKQNLITRILIHTNHNIIIRMMIDSKFYVMRKMLYVLTCIYPSHANHNILDQIMVDPIIFCYVKTQTFSHASIHANHNILIGIIIDHTVYP